MHCLMVKRCCCCISLKRAGIIFGLLEICAFVFNLIFMHEYEHIEPYFEIQIDQNDIKWVLVDYAISIFGILASALWLYGIFNERPLFMILEIIWSFVFVILIGIVAFIAWLAASQNPKTNATTLFLATYGIIAVLFYFWIVRYSLYKSMRKTRNEMGENGKIIALNTLHAV